MNISKHSIPAFLPLLAAVAFPVILGACSSSSSPAPAPTPPSVLPVATVAGDVSTNEGDTGTKTLSFTVQLDKPADGPVTVDYETADGTATAGSDYVAATGSTVISPAQTSKTVDVTINGDLKFEADETLTLSITSVSSNVTLGSASSATGTINNDDAAPVVLFIADRETDGVNELWMYSVDTGGPVKINGALTTAGTGGNVTSFAMSPNRQWIAYVADQEVDEKFELYVRDAALANPPTKISRDVLADGDVSDNPVWAPDTSRIAYRGDVWADEKFDLTTVTPGGGSAIVVLPAGTNTSADVVQGSYVWAPDGSRIAYLADVNTAGLFEVLTSTPNGSDIKQLNATLTAGQEITDHAWDPGSSRIAYRANQGTNAEYDLYVAAADTANSGTGVADTSGSTTADVQAGTVSWAPDGSRLAFIADLVSDGINELFTVLPDNSAAPLRINANITGQKDVIGTPSWAPDSSRIAYVSDINSQGTFELFTSQPTVANTGTKVSGTLTATTDVETEPGDNLAAPAWSPDSTSLIYVADQDNAGKKEVYVGAADGSGNTKVSGATMLGNASISGDGESWAPDGSQILYRADQDVLGTVSLWTSTPSGGSNTKLTEPTPADTTPLSGSDKWSPDSSYVAYAADQDTSGVIELFIATPAGIRTKVSGARVTSGDVDPDTFVWAP